MSKKIVFISDFFSNQVLGGAEIYDDILITCLQERGNKVCKFNSLEFTDKHLQLYLKTGYYFIVSNFVNLSQNIRKRLEACSDRYIILEHDHKYVSNRNPAVFENFQAPSHMIVNKSFYAAAKVVFCQSSIHADTLSKNLNINNVTSLGCSLWSKEQLDFISSNIKQKNEKSFILNDTNPIKGLKDALKFCNDKKISYDLVDKMPYEKFIEKLSSYDRFVFFPKSLESFCRVILEARMLGCKLVTNKLNGCTYEPWFKQYKGQELIDFVDNQRGVIVETIETKLFQHSEQKSGDITVILNCYRRPHNLQMQVEAIRKQSIKPVQIWLWINYHEDNKDFDPTSLDVDKVFNNDYNWKFYGRFAAALLADTEYVAMYDDDTVPGQNWHKNCLETMETHEGILGSAGVILKGKQYVQHDRCGWPTNNDKVTEVDLVGHSWFFKREWLRYLWQEKPVTWDNGEDIQFGFMAKIHGGIPTYCPPHPADDRTMHGSILGNELGIDDKATSNNRAVSHQAFFSERDSCVQEGLRKGWKTVRQIKL